MVWKSHWHKTSPKCDWADDIRDDLKKAFPHQPTRLMSLDKMKRGDLMALAEMVGDLVKIKEEKS